MGIQNTKGLQNFIVEQEISEEQEKDIEYIIGAFSEYIVAANPDYVYNKTYLSAFVKDFILCQKVLKRKYQILCDKILAKLMSRGIETWEYVIKVDGVWKCENGKLELSNSINPYYTKRNKMQIEIELLHDHGFVLADKINIDNEYDMLLDDLISTFVEQRKELLDEKTE